MTIRGIAWEGGGVLGLAYLRPLHRLDEELPRGLDQLEICAGTSAGAITAALVALGARGDDLDRIIEGTPWDELAADSWGVLRDTWRILTTGGWHRPDVLREWLTDAVTSLGHRADITLGQLVRTRHVELHVAAVNESRARLEVLGPQTTPTVPIVDAVMASAAIPLFWPVVQIGANDYSDGGLLNNHPVDVLAARLAPAEVLGFRLVNRPGGTALPSRRGPLARVQRLVRILLDHARDGHVPDDYWPRIVTIDCGRLSAVDFDLTAAQREWLMGQGEAAWERWAKTAA